MQFIGKKVKATQKLNALHCKEQLKSFHSLWSSVCAPFVALHTWRRYSTSCQTFCNKRWYVFAIAVRIRSFKLFRIMGIGRK